MKVLGVELNPDPFDIGINAAQLLWGNAFPKGLPMGWHSHEDPLRKERHLGLRPGGDVQRLDIALLSSFSVLEFLSVWGSS